MITTEQTTVGSGNGDLRLPRILCLHGAGVNAAIFKLQCRALITHLKGRFRLVFADGPYSSEAGPGILPTFERHGPYRRWLRWKSSHPHQDSETIIKDIDTSIYTAMANDDWTGASGEWVGILGFSQGAKVAGSLLLRQQIRTQKGITKGNTTFRFAILMNGRGPLVSLDTHLVTSPRLAAANEVTVNDVEHLMDEPEYGKEYRLRLPTLHVHGLKDPGLRHHRHLLENYCRKESRSVIQWNGDHRIPIKKEDVAPMVKKLLEIAIETKAVR